MSSQNFADLIISPNIIQALSKLGFVKMTPIQSLCIPEILLGKDVIGQSKTGSGKTLTFLIPILQKTQLKTRKPQVLILCPTRELCDQIMRECQKFSKYFPQLKTVTLIGGQVYATQAKALKDGVHWIVGTPGRTLEHLKSHTFSAAHMSLLVLDEADRLLEEGFAEEMTSILGALPAQRQTLLFSATFPPAIEELSRRHQTEALRITVDKAGDNDPAITQYLYAAEKPQKTEILLEILKRHPSKCSLLFCRTKALVDEIGKLLIHHKIDAQTLHSNLTQAERDKVTKLFRTGGLQILVATDLAARGLDIDFLELVVNVDLPSSSDIYIHRIGRTGRAGRSGNAVSIMTEYEIPLVAEIESATGIRMIRSN